MMNENQYKGSKILLVEDEENLAIGLEFNLIEEGYEVVLAKDGKEALNLFQSQQFDLIVLDIMIPYHDGFEVAEKIRKTSPQIPILMLTARTAAIDRIHGLEIGADDYLIKPFELAELLLRIRGMLKRKMWYQDFIIKQPVFIFGKNEINFENMYCKSDKREFILTHQELILLKYLIDNKNRIISRKELLENVWHISSDVETRTVDNFIVRLRKYFEPNPSKPIYFQSIRSAGYMFCVDDNK